MSGSGSRIWGLTREELEYAARLDDDIWRVIEDELDDIDRKAPLPDSTILATNRLLKRARRLLSRWPSEFTLPPLTGPVVMPADAFIALLKARLALERRRAV